LNQFAEDVTGRQTLPVEAEQGKLSLEDLTARFKSVTPEEFIAERDNGSKRPFLTPYTAEDMKGWQLYLTDDGVGLPLSPMGI